MSIGIYNPYRPVFDFGAAFAQTAAAAARPAFELQFFLTQSSLLDQLDKEVENINSAINTSGATALLDIQISKLNTDLASINDFKARTDAKSSRVSDTLTSLAELSTLAAPGTVAEFDTKLTETISLLRTTNAPVYERYGVQDRLRLAKTDALAQLEALVHNNFATQTDIDDTTAIIAAIQTDYLASQSIVESNVEIGFNLQQSAQTTIGELGRQVSGIKADALGAATGAVKEKQAFYAQLLSTISLSFEASQAFTTFIAENISQSQEPEPGSVLNLFS